jgi:hypothetical protein
VQVVNATTPSNEQREFRLNLMLMLVLGGGGLVLLLLPLGGISQSALGNTWGFWLPLGLGLSLVAAGTWFGREVWIYQRSQISQERLCRLLKAFLGDDFIYFRNLTLPGTRSVGEINGVLLGSHGALVLQVEPGGGEFDCEGDTWYRYPSNPGTGDSNLAKKRRRMADSPSWAAIRAGREVKAWLSVRDLPAVPVRPVVVLVKGKMRSLKRPSCPVVELNSLQTFIQNSLLEKSPQLNTAQISGGAVEQIAQRLQS